MKKRRRRKFREIEVIETLLLQGTTILCFRCKLPITREDVKVGNVQKEHLHEFNLDGPDVPDNCRFSHKGKPCHHFVTYGNGATTAGSSKNRLAKANNPKRRVNFVVSKRPVLDVQSVTCDACLQQYDPLKGHACPALRELTYSRPGERSAKPKQQIKSRCFDKSRTRRFDGTVAARKRPHRNHAPQGDTDGR